MSTVAHSGSLQRGVRAGISSFSALAVIRLRLSLRARCRSFAIDLPRQDLPKSFSSMSGIVPDVQREVNFPGGLDVVFTDPVRARLIRLGALAAPGGRPRRRTTPPQ